MHFLVGVGLAEFFRVEVDLGEQAAEDALEGFVLDVLEAVAQGLQQIAALVLGQIGDTGPQVLGLDDVVHLTAHLLLELDDVAWIVDIPQRQRRAGSARGQIGVVRPEFLLRRRLVVVGEIAKEEEGQHVIAEVVRIHRAAQLVGGGPEDLAEALLFGGSHAGFGFSLRSFGGACV
jgi:hypothetical protein